MRVAASMLQTQPPTRSTAWGQERMRSGSRYGHGRRPWSRCRRSPPGPVRREPAWRPTWRRTGSRHRRSVVAITTRLNRRGSILLAPAQPDREFAGSGESGWRSWPSGEAAVGEAIGSAVRRGASGTSRPAGRVETQNGSDAVLPMPPPTSTIVALVAVAISKSAFGRGPTRSPARVDTTTPLAVAAGRAVPAPRTRPWRSPCAEDLSPRDGVELVVAPAGAR